MLTSQAAIRDGRLPLSGIEPATYPRGKNVASDLPPNFMYRLTCDTYRTASVGGQPVSVWVSVSRAGVPSH